MMNPFTIVIGLTRISLCRSLVLYSCTRKFGEEVSSWTAAEAETGPHYMCGAIIA